MFEQSLISFAISALSEFYGVLAVCFAFLTTGWVFGMFAFAFYKVTLGMKGKVQ